MTSLSTEPLLWPKFEINIFKVFQSFFLFFKIAAAVTMQIICRNICTVAFDVNNSTRQIRTNFKNCARWFGFGKIDGLGGIDSKIGKIITNYGLNFLSSQICEACFIPPCERCLFGWLFRNFSLYCDNIFGQSWVKQTY